MNNIFKILFLFIALFFVTEATHFRFGTISWQPTTAYNVIKFSSNFAFRSSFYSPNTAAGRKVGDVLTLGTLSFGSGQGSVSVSATVTNVDVTNDWFTASFTTTKTYSTVAANSVSSYTAIFTDCCRITTLLNNAEGSWNITSKVFVNNTGSLGDLNWSPVSGMSPIVKVIANKNNNFMVVANDPNSNPNAPALKFSFSTTYSMTQPSGMTIDTNGNAYFLPTKVGLYSTQIYILDSQGAYIVVDFILQSVVEPGKCDTSCNNAGTACTGNSQCTGCTNSGSTTIDTCTTSNLPPFFVQPPTPGAGDTLPFPVNATTSFTLTCKSPFTNRTVDIQAANVPSGATFTTKSQVLTDGVVTNYTYSWKPSTNNVGAYVVSAFCVDSTSLTSPVRSFTIYVDKPGCGNGVGNPTTGCVCSPGWDPLTKCFDCLDGYYGPKCIPVPDCDNGTPNSGVVGDGKCLCNNGWTGAACNVSLSQSCAGLASNVLSTTNVIPSYINPSKIQVYLSNTPNYNIPSIISIPRPINLLDVYVLVDANMASSTVFSYIKNNMGTFVNSISGVCENAQFGLGFFSDNTATPFNFQPSLTIGSAIAAGVNLYSPSTYTTTSNKNSLLAATNAASTALGWNTGSFKTIVIITDNDHSATAAAITAFTNTFIDGSIVPVVIGMGVDTPNWASTISSSGFGYNAKSTATNGDWATQAAAGVNNVLSKVIFKSSTTATGSSFVTTVPATVAVSQTGSTQQTVNGLTLTRPSSPVTSPVASISAMGYGRIDITINYNRPPVATSSAFSVDQNSFASFKLTGSDVDSNILKFKFVEPFLPASAGVIKNNGVDVSTQPDTYYASTENFVYTPTNNYISPSTVKFIANDGCEDSASTATVSITINRVNQAPTCSSKSISATYQSPVTFQLSGADFEDSSSQIGILINNPSVITAYGTLTYNGVAVTSSTKITNLQNVILNQTVNPASAVSVVAQFQSIDSKNAISSVCTLSVGFVHTNIAPVSSSQTPISVIPLGDTQVSLISTDTDSTTATFTITAITGQGTFHLCSDTSNTPVAITVNQQYTLAYSDDKANQTICFKVASAVAVSNYATISFKSQDEKGAVSNTVTVTINVVGTRANAAPVVIQIPDYECYQDYIDSSAHIVDGTDSDSLDQGNLIAIITKKPQYGTLLILENGANSSAISQSKAPMTHYYRPNAGFNGTDSYSYQVMDTLNVVSSIATTTITVKPINHKPTVTVNSYTFTSQSGGDGTGPAVTLSTNDIDFDAVVCSVVALPSKITMLNSQGNPITTVPTILSGNSYSFQLSDPSAINPTAFSNVQSTFTINCVDITSKTTPFGSLSTGNVVGNVYYTYINTAPTTNGGTIQLDQDTSVAFTFNASDTETATSGIKAKIFDLPNHGTLSTSNGQVLTQANVGTTTYVLDALTYTPSAGLSNWDTFDNQSPLDSISYAVVDPEGLVSSSSIVIFSVRPRNPPVYTGADEIDVLQNTRYPLNIEGKIGNGGSEVNIQVISFTGRGNLSIVHVMGSEGSVDTLISSYPSTVLIGSTSYAFAYMPPLNQFGKAFDTITFRLLDHDLVSMVYTITVNVIHVNQPPTIRLISYKVLESAQGHTTFGVGNVVNMNVNTSVLIKYIGEDIDANSTLSSVVANVPLRGAVYAYDPTASDSLGAIITRTSPSVSVSEDGFWYVVFVPNKGSTSESYARVPLTITDEGGLVSSPATVLINVNSVNIPPVVTVGNQKNSALVNVIVSIADVSFDDPDSLNNNVKLVVSIVSQSDDNEVESLDNVRFSLTQTSSACIFNTTQATATCIGTKKTLNKLITSISIVGQKGGNYRLKLFVDDLGFNAPSAVRESSHLTAVGFVSVTIITPDVTTQTNTNKTVLSGAIAGAAAGAALLAVGLWRLLRKAAPPTDMFFGEAAFGGDGVSSNPLYQQSENSAVNPLYEGAN